MIEVALDTYKIAKKTGVEPDVRLTQLFDKLVEQNLAKVRYFVLII